jgi:hypothetical protein
MPIAAHTTGGHATPHLLLGLAILLLALAGAGTMLSAATRLARHTKRALSARHRRARSRQRDRTHTAAPTAPGTPDPTAAPPTPQPTAHQSPHAASSGGGALRALNPDTSAPSNPGARRSPETLEPLADSLRSARLRTIAEAHVAETLTALPSDRWYVGRYVLMDGHRIPFVILGETGAYAVWALTGPPVWDELPFPSEMADRVKRKLPGISRAGAGRPVPRTRPHRPDRTALVVPPRPTRRLDDGTRMADPLDRALRPPARVRGRRHSTPTGARQPATRRPSPTRTRRRARHRLTTPIPRDAGPLSSTPFTIEPVGDRL